MAAPSTSGRGAGGREMFNLGYSVCRAPRGPRPAALAPAETLRLAVSYGVLAPSIYNTQPWLFRIDGDTLELRADPTRALPVTDPDYRELTISCGAALMNVRAALRHFGYAGDVSLLPDPSQPTLLARVRTGPRAEETDEDRTLFFAIERRHTTLGEFGLRPVRRSNAYCCGPLPRVSTPTSRINRSEIRDCARGCVSSRPTRARRSS